MTIKKICEQGSIPDKYGIVLKNIAEEYRTKHILELGTSLGINTAYLCESNHSFVTTIEEGIMLRRALGDENHVDTLKLVPVQQSGLNSHRVCQGRTSNHRHQHGRDYPHSHR